MHAKVSYGKGGITLYRTYARPMHTFEPAPEARARENKNEIFAVALDIEIFGDSFLPAYTQGDNSNLIATDTIKNFIVQQALAFHGATLEDFLAFLSHRFLSFYPQVNALRILGRQQPFDAVSVLGEKGRTPVESSVLFSRSRNSYATAVLEIERNGEHFDVVAHRCGCQGLQLVKLTGSSFEHFLRDAYTSLPEQSDRALFMYLDVFWKYTDIASLLKSDNSHFIRADQILRIVCTTFHRFQSKSIQHLLHAMGNELLQTFPQMEEIAFEAQNRVWETACVCETDPNLKIYVDPRPPYGTIKLALERSELACSQQRQEEGTWCAVSQPMYLT